MLKICGGTYFERCREPFVNDLNGSGLRAAIALSGKSFDVSFASCIGREDEDTAMSICNTYGIESDFLKIDTTISFNYDHPLSRPAVHPFMSNQSTTIMRNVHAEHILYYGMLEASITVKGDYVVYDPQNWIGFKDTGSQANHLALILNSKEAMYLSGVSGNTDLPSAGRKLLLKEGAEVVVIKDGTNGAHVITIEESVQVPVFCTKTVWPIGSGDIFSAVFAWKWIKEKLPANVAAQSASMYTAYYCETREAVLPLTHPHFYPVISALPKKIYLAGPFFTTGERWLISELRKCLKDFGNKVFSPMHDVGIGKAADIVNQDIAAIVNADVLLAVVSGKDAGTMFEVGYARSLGIRVVVFAENVAEEDLLMLVGTGCEITNDLSTAVYKASW